MVAVVGFQDVAVRAGFQERLTGIAAAAEDVDGVLGGWFLRIVSPQRGWDHNGDFLRVNRHPERSQERQRGTAGVKNSFLSKNFSKRKKIEKKKVPPTVWRKTDGAIFFCKKDLRFLHFYADLFLQKTRQGMILPTPFCAAELYFLFFIFFLMTNRRTKHFKKAAEKKWKRQRCDGFPAHGCAR